MKEIRLCDDRDIEYTPNAIWNIECKVKYLEESIEESIEKLKELKYIETGD